MLGKLLKYENKTLSKTLFPLGIGVLLIALFSSLIMKLNLYLQDQANEFVSKLMGTTTVVLLVFSFLAIFSAAFIAVFLILQRYYKSFFTDEGYLTFTLPVKTHELIFTKLISSLLWSLFVTICVMIAVALFALFGTTQALLNQEVANGARLLLKELGNFFTVYKGTAVFLAFEFLLVGITSFCMQFLMFELAITLGSIVAKKHKILASIGMYFVVNFACQSFNSILTIFTLPALLLNESMQFQPDEPQTVALFLILPVILYAIYTVVFFLINRYLLKNKLNLD